MTRYGKRDHSLSNDNVEKMAKIHGQVGIYGIGNESSMGKYNHLPTVWQKQGLSATFVEGAVASLPPLLPRAVNRARTFHGKIPERSKVNLTRARRRQRVYGDLRVNRKLIFDLQYLRSGNARWSVQVCV